MCINDFYKICVLMSSIEYVYEWIILKYMFINDFYTICVLMTSIEYVY